jgi:hypothetical protein
VSAIKSFGELFDVLGVEHSLYKVGVRY